MNDEDQNMRPAGFLVRQEFEAALPLYVGGDLPAEEAQRVELWIDMHPEDREEFDSAVAAYALVSEHAQRVRSAAAESSLDLWPGLRQQLRAEGLVSGDPQVPASPIEEPSWATRERTRRGLLGSGRTLVSAAAALLVCGGLAAVLTWGPGETPGATDPIPQGSSVVTFTGTEEVPASARLASGQVGAQRSKSKLEQFRLRPTGGRAEHLVEGAIALPGRQALPVGWQLAPPAEGRDETLQLTSGPR